MLREMLIYALILSSSTECHSYQQFPRGLNTKPYEWVPEKSMDAYNNALRNIIRIYTSAGFQVSTLSCDREYAPLINEIQDEFHITPHFSSAQEHVPEAERNN
jgi:hypothetical protein